MTQKLENLLKKVKHYVNRHTSCSDDKLIPILNLEIQNDYFQLNLEERKAFHKHLISNVKQCGGENYSPDWALTHTLAGAGIGGVVGLFTLNPYLAVGACALGTILGGAVGPSKHAEAYLELLQITSPAWIYRNTCRKDPRFPNDEEKVEDEDKINWKI